MDLLYFKYIDYIFYETCSWHAEMLGVLYLTYAADKTDMYVYERCLVGLFLIYD